MVEYITKDKFKSYMEVDGDFRDGKITPIVDMVNAEFSDITGDKPKNNVLHMKALKYAEYQYMQTPGVSSDDNYSYKDDDLGPEDFIPDRYIVEEDATDQDDNIGVQFI